MSEKNRDNKGRWRTKTIAFRLSPEEAVELDDRVKLCGARTKQDYIIESVLYQRVVAKGTPQMFVQFKKDLLHIEKELIRLQSLDEMDEELLTPIRTMLEIIEAFENEKES